MAVALKVKIGEKILRVRRGNFSCRKVVPFVERGPCGCWLASWQWGQVGWELERWT